MVRIADMHSNWKEIWTAKKAEEELRKGEVQFKFKGPGWYITKDETVLVYPYNPVEDPWVQNWSENQRFVFMFYLYRNPADVFNAIVNAPVRQDERQEEIDQ